MGQSLRALRMLTAREPHALQLLGFKLFLLPVEL